jgi:hypothetical protein
MSVETLSHAERLALRLIDGDRDEATYHEFRFEALAMAHTWESAWLAEELVATFEKAGQDQRPHSETAAVVLGMLRGVRLARAHGEASAKSPAWASPALAAAGVTALGMIMAAVINQYGASKVASNSQAAVQPAVVKPQIQIVLPSSAANAPPAQTVVQQQPASSPATSSPKPAPTASASPVAKSSPATAAQPPAQDETPDETPHGNGPAGSH